MVTTIAGSAGLSGNLDGTGSAARFNRPAAVAVDAAGIVRFKQYGPVTPAVIDEHLAPLVASR